MPKRIYVGNLPFTVSEADVRGALAGHGEVKGVEIKTSAANKVAVAIVVMEGEGPNAVAALNGRMVQGHKIVASEDRSVVINHEEQYS